VRCGWFYGVEVGVEAGAGVDWTGADPPDAAVVRMLSKKLELALIN
jgi:hypothetical protein